MKDRCIKCKFSGREGFSDSWKTIVGERVCKGCVNNIVSQLGIVFTYTQNETTFVTIEFISKAIEKVCADNNFLAQALRRHGYIVLDIFRGSVSIVEMPEIIKKLKNAVSIKFVSGYVSDMLHDLLVVPDL